MAEQKEMTETPAAAPRRMSFTQRLLGNSKDLFSAYHNSQEKDDQMYGHGFNDQADDLIPAFIENNATRRRNSSVSSDTSIEGMDGMRRNRQNSITDRIAGMQLMRKPTDKFEGFATTISSCVDDQ